MNCYDNPQADQAQFDRFPADFGIEGDWSAVRAKRKSMRTPFEWAKNLWPRIEERKWRFAAKVASDIPGRDAEPDALSPAKETEEPADRAMGHDVCDDNSESRREVPGRGSAEGMMTRKRYGF